METFDFGSSSDFALPSGLGDFSIFGQPPTSHAPSDGGSSAHASHHPSPSNLSRIDALPSSHLPSSHTSPSINLGRARFEESASPQSASSSANVTGGVENRMRKNSGADAQYGGYLQQQTPQQLMQQQPQQPQQQQQPQSHIPQQQSHQHQQLQHHRHFAQPQTHLHPQQHPQQPSPPEQQQSGLMPQMSIADLQRILLEKERSERIQTMQTALLKQQLEQLQRMQQAHQGQSQGGPGQPSAAPVGHSVAPSLGTDLSQNQQSSFLAALQSILGSGGQQGAAGPDQQNGQHGQWTVPASGLLTPGSGGNETSAALAQYGLLTPLGSGAFNNTSCPPGQASFMSPLNMPVGSQSISAHPVEAPRGFMNQYTPVESPAVTPASVFSNASTGIVMHELFSPLTSPALGPQPPSLGELMLPPAQMGHLAHQQMQQQASSLTASPAFNAVVSNTPTASPLALMGKPNTSGSKIRKNRSTTAEARANKVRPSPLIKPTHSSIGRRKKDSISNGSATNVQSIITSTSGPSSRRPSVSEAGSRGHSRHLSMEAPHSDGTSSTPSPIDLSGESMPPPTLPPSKPLTPGSVMGLRPSEGKHSSLQNLAPVPGPRNPPAASAIKGKNRAEGEHSAQQQQYANIAPAGGAQPSGPKVTFNIGNGTGSNGGGTSYGSGHLPHILPNGALPIQPGGLSQADREAWMSYKSAGGLESRRTSHKAAEQKRRDSLKFCFDELRGLMPAITLDEDAPGGSLLGPDGRSEDQTAERFNVADVGDPEMAHSANKAISKVALLRHSNEYLVRLKKRLARRDEALEVCRKEIAELRHQLGLPAPEDPVLTGKGVAWAAGDRAAARDATAQQQQDGDAKPEAEGQAGSQMDEDASLPSTAATGMDTS
ncbi:hypothetical protein ACQY0O_005754 [Thecaphora frezii]